MKKDRLPLTLAKTSLGLAVLALGSDYFRPGVEEELGRYQLLVAAVGAAIALAGAAVGRREVWKHRGDLLRFLLVAAQVGVLVLLVRWYHIENQAFQFRIFPLVFCGFVLHHLLPLPLRKPFFVLLGALGLFGVLGWGSGLAVIAVGAVLLGVAHLPVRFGVRVALLLVLAGVLSAARAKLLPLPIDGSVWPILGAIFMFRLIVYMYDLKHRKGPVSPASTLAYFLMVPNVVFVLYPVVDYKTFERQYYAGGWYSVYRQGADWILRGIVHLLLYRYVNTSLALPPEEVTNAGELFRHIVANFMLYLRISGQFHIIVGMLHLFGFRLPETNHLFFLASSFTDFWRRINIYWKDFMLKVFYYPVYFRAKRLGATPGLVIATLVVFAVTWFLHAWQWFWLRGTFLLTAVDVAFWTIFACFVLVNSLWEARHSRKRTLGRADFSLRDLLVRAGRTAAFFLTICALWSLWTSATFVDWISLWSVPFPTLADLRTMLPAAAALGAAMLAMYVVAVPRGAAPARPGKRPGGPWTRAWTSAAVPCALLLLLAAAGSPAGYSRLGGETRELVGLVRVPRLSRQDERMLRRGYYEDLVGVNRFNSRLWEIYAKRPEGWKTIEQTPAGRLTNDIWWVELVPNTNIVFRAAPCHVNRWGMRDEDYERKKPPGTVRLALIGSSQVAGWGVGDGEKFDALIEDRWNACSPGRRYEILNFAVGGYTPIQQMLVVEEKIAPFSPDVMIYVAHPVDPDRTVYMLSGLVREGVEVRYEFLRERLLESGAERGMSREEIIRRLTPHAREICAWIYRRIGDWCRENGVEPVWVLLPMEPGGHDPPPARFDELRAMARDAGLIALDLSDVYEGHDIRGLQCAPWDRHPGVKGHRVLADRLDRALRETDLGIPLPGGE